MRSQPPLAIPILTVVSSSDPDPPSDDPAVSPDPSFPVPPPDPPSPEPSLPPSPPPSPPAQPASPAIPVAPTLARNRRRLGVSHRGVRSLLRTMYGVSERPRISLAPRERRSEGVFSRGYHPLAVATDGPLRRLTVVVSVPCGVSRWRRIRPVSAQRSTRRGVRSRSHWRLRAGACRRQPPRGRRRGRSPPARGPSCARRRCGGGFPRPRRGR